MYKNYLNIYNNLIKLTRNKSIYENIGNKDTFSTRMIIFLFHFAFFLKIYKLDSDKKTLQDIYDFIFKQIDLSIREIGYGDQSVNKEMKVYINTLYSIIDKVELWDDFNDSKKEVFLKNFLSSDEDMSFLNDYFTKYQSFLKNNSLNYFTKVIKNHKF
tara:strand:+ start:1029 stop:1502 length:474 start_codon:yes stop_codon:yes gene_type:complete